MRHADGQVYDFTVHSSEFLCNNGPEPTVVVQVLYRSTVLNLWWFRFIGNSYHEQTEQNIKLRYSFKVMCTVY